MSSDIIIIVVTLILSGFFSGMEIAYISANKVHLSIYKSDKSIIASAINRLMAKPEKYIATTLVGNNLVLVIYGYYMGRLIIQTIYPDYLYADGLPVVVLLVQTLISTIVILVTGEFLPKTIFRIYSDKMIYWLAIPMFLIYKVLDWLWITDFMLWLSKFMIRSVFKQEDGPIRDFTFKRADLGYYIEEQIEGLDEKQLEQMDNEINIFRNALEFKDVKARECMIPRTEMKALDIKTEIEDLRSMFIDTGFSKIIIYRENIDDILGYVHSFDLFKPQITIREMLLPVVYVPETMPINEILNDLTHKRMSIAIVLDEYGGTAGMITVEDIIEELLGDIEDEHDKDLLIEKDLGDGNYLFSARQDVDYLNEEYKLDLPESDEYETLGGLILNHTGNIPQNGDVIRVDGFEFTIKNASNIKIETVLLSRKTTK